MSEIVQAIPAGYHSVTPCLLIRGAADAIAFYQNAFGAVEVMRLLGPQSRGGTSVTMLVYVQDVDQVFSQAVEAGAIELRPVYHQFYGDRSGTVVDPWGHVWSLATHIEDVAAEEVQRRFQELFGEATE